MDYIELKDNACLRVLALRLNISIAELENKVLSRLKTLGVLEDCQDYAGQSIDEIINFKGLNIVGVTVLTFSRCDEFIQDLFEGLIVVSSSGDCDHCGRETEVYTERVFGTVYKVKRCYDRNACKWESREVYNG